MRKHGGNPEQRARGGIRGAAARNPALPEGRARVVGRPGGLKLFKMLWFSSGPSRYAAAGTMI
ncbi:MAG: hypothetical protein V8Q84_03260 [Bilophila sp.]